MSKNFNLMIILSMAFNATTVSVANFNNITFVNQLKFYGNAYYCMQSIVLSIVTLCAAKTDARTSINTIHKCKNKRQISSSKYYFHVV